MLQGLTLEEEVVLGVVKQMKREARVNAAAVGALLIDCAVELPTKVPLYALLTGRRCTVYFSVIHSMLYHRFIYLCRCKPYEKLNRNKWWLVFWPLAGSDNTLLFTFVRIRAFVTCMTCTG